MKKLLSALLVASMFLSAGCSGGGAVSGTEETVVTAEAQEEQSPDISGLSSQEIVNDMKIGWNLGDTLDSCQADRDGDGIINEHAEDGQEPDETLWGNPRATKELFQALLDSGVNAVRIPVTWRDHIDAEGNVTAAWMDRVQEVVDYAYDLGMYVIINVHHDGGGDPQFGAWICNAATDYDGTLARYKRLWTQIAERFQDYDEKLIFESMNEVGFDSLSTKKGIRDPQFAESGVCEPHTLCRGQESGQTSAYSGLLDGYRKDLRFALRHAGGSGGALHGFRALLHAVGFLHH